MSASESEKQRVTGKVKWFNDQKGFGFITTDEGGGDLFVHQSSIRSDGFRSLALGESVEFLVDSDPEGRTKAVDVTGPDQAPVQGTRGAGGGRPAYGGAARGGRPGYGGGGYGGYGGGGGGGGCYKCGETGHIARDCSQGGGGRYGGSGGGGGGGSCYNCGESGHFARDCPSNGR